MDEQKIYKFFIELLEFYRRFLTEWKRLTKEYGDLARSLGQQDILFNYIMKLPDDKLGKVFKGYMLLAKYSQKISRMTELSEDELDEIIKAVEDGIKAMEGKEE
jgi:hypothetical protein